MRLSYTQENNTTYVEALDQELNGYMHKHLLYAEIDQSLGGSYMLRWESDYSHPVHFDTLPDAKIYAEKNYFKHTPSSLGERYLLLDEDN